MEDNKEESIGPSLPRIPDALGVEQEGVVELIIAGRQGDNIGETIVTVANMAAGRHERDEVSQRAPDTNHEEDYRDPE